MNSNHYCKVCIALLCTTEQDHGPLMGWGTHHGLHSTDNYLFQYKRLSKSLCANPTVWHDGCPIGSVIGNIWLSKPQQLNVSCVFSLIQVLADFHASWVIVLCCWVVMARQAQATANWIRKSRNRMIMYCNSVKEIHQKLPSWAELNIL